MTYYTVNDRVNIIKTVVVAAVVDQLDSFRD